MVEQFFIRVMVTRVVDGHETTDEVTEYEIVRDTAAEVDEVIEAWKAVTL